MKRASIDGGGLFPNFVVDLDTCKSYFPAAYSFEYDDGSCCVSVAIGAAPAAAT